MNKRMKFMLGATVLSAFVMVTAVPGFASSSQQKVSGGWSESEGYYIHAPNGWTHALSSSSTRMKRGANSPSKHEGKRLTREFSHGGDFEYAAYGETTWKDTCHYTTARMEDTEGHMLTTSGRKWGIGFTTAQSPWYTPKLFENTEARTYWGNEGSGNQCKDR
ncbi:hypothetical protein [Paenibacillus popilliae]|uniref:Uncharacterized protein n=1 Tax=Paenibacillus popilliae ATCC 14706 TaxID=1212764 RepID=M9LFS3_PAEPP|nr:hypothetical protein [Paenibacillus popilliae]GAC41195.1 hypothetical protein PPOP_0544 [Paenibacillus popilliae ATCC 14706]